MTSTVPAPPTYPLDPRGFQIYPKPYGVWKDGILYNSRSVEKLVTTYSDKVHTLADVFITSVGQHSARPAVGTRQLISRDMVEDPKDKKKYEKLSLGPYSWLTYGQWDERIRNFGSGLMQFAGLTPKDRVLVYAETQRDWMTACLACYFHNLTVVTCYATLGADAAAFSINQTKATVVIADSKLLPNMVKVQNKCPALKSVVSMSDFSEDDKAKLEKSGLRLATMDGLVAEGAKTPVEKTLPSPSDIAVIMYTSGTTGNPKGVVLTHSSVLAAIAGIDMMFAPMFTCEDVYVAYLPLAHIMEMIAELAMIRLGVSMGYGNPHTLTASGVKLAAGSQGDLVELKPTIVVFAPLVLEKLYNGVIAKVEAAGGLKKWLFDKSVASGVWNFEHGQVGASWLWNALVLKNIQAMVGGRLRMIVTGSAPLDANVHKFVQAVFNCPVRQGYGATETSAASVTNELCDSSAGIVGPPRASCAIKLVDWEEGGYRFSDKDNPEIGVPRGEIVIGGEPVALGYLTDPDHPDPELEEKNRTDFRTDEKGMRWFYTGDIGQVDANGCLKIIDRKKDLVKLQQGEYVALSKVEGVMKLCHYVENALCHAQSDQKFCTGLICPNYGAISRFCELHNIPHEDRETMANDPAINAEVLRAIKEVAKGKLSGFEIPEKISLIPPSLFWTPENDMLTAAMKLKRKPICNAHSAALSAMYA